MKENPNVDPGWEEALERVRQVAAACVEADLERLGVEEPAFSVEVRRSPRRASLSASPASEQSLSEGHLEQVSASNDGLAAVSESVMLKADFVGIVRLSRPVVSEGSLVNEDRELAYVESLGTRNPIRAARRGKITAVHVVDGQAVDYGHPLFAVEYE